MNFWKKLLSISTVSSLMLIGGCSDLFQKDVVSHSIENNKFKANCELNVDEFALILEEDIQGTIDCLGKNLELFIKAVETTRPGYLSRNSLMEYLKANRKDIKPEVLRALKSVFDINFLFYGEDVEWISHKNIKGLISTAKIFNKKASANFKPIFMSEGAITYDHYRFSRDQRIKPAAIEIATALTNVYHPNRNGQIHKLDINNLLDSFTTESNTASMAKVKKLLFVKKILLGGESDQITHLELGRLIENFSSFAVMGLDAVRFSDITFEPGTEQESKIQLMNSDLEMLNSIIFPSRLANRDKEKFFNLKQAIDAFNIITDGTSTLDLSKYYELIKEAKQIIMDGTPETVTGADLKRLINHGLSLLKTGSYFHRFWATERTRLEARPAGPVTGDFTNLYLQFSDQTARVDDFVRILKKYRFMKGENLTAYYSDEYRRNSNAVFEIAIYEYALTLVMKKYGCPNNTLGGLVVCDSKGNLNNVYMKKDHVVNLIQKFKKVLIENDMISPGNEVSTAETITLLGSLFQNQSDENKVFDVNEATEFAISLFTSIDISTELDNFYLEIARKDKTCKVDEFGRIEPECFREHFFEGLCLNFPDSFPKLFDSLGATIYENKSLVCKVPKLAGNVAYLDKAIKAARTCNIYPNTAEEIYYSKGDMMTIILAMMHIETTILRWDTRHLNNLMDEDEVMDAYNIYAPALDGFLEDQPTIIKKLKKQIYQYLVKYEQVPDTKQFSTVWKFAKFLLSFKKGATANRKTVGSILQNISEQGEPSKFDCDLLRNPENIPEDYDPNMTSARAADLSPVATLTRGDIAVAADIELEKDSAVEGWVKKNWSDLLSFLF